MSPEYLKLLSLSLSLSPSFIFPFSSSAPHSVLHFFSGAEIVIFFLMKSVHLRVFIFSCLNLQIWRNNQTVVKNLGGPDSYLRPFSCINITSDGGCVTCGDFCVSACIMHHCLSVWDDVYISVTVSIYTRCRCVWVKIQMDVFSSHFPESWLCARCPLPPMTQCPSAPKHSPPHRDSA